MQRGKKQLKEEKANHYEAQNNVSYRVVYSTWHYSNPKQNIKQVYLILKYEYLLLQSQNNN